jgi:hypothetical protein
MNPFGFEPLRDNHQHGFRPGRGRDPHRGAARQQACRLTRVGAAATGAANMVATTSKSPSRIKPSDLFPATQPEKATPYEAKPMIGRCKVILFRRIGAIAVGLGLLGVVVAGVGCGDSRERGRQLSGSVRRHVLALNFGVKPDTVKARFGAPQSEFSTGNEVTLKLCVLATTLRR